MDIAAPKKRKVEENVIPMINVVFLLLIFFLMTAQIAPPEPFEVDPPASPSITPADGPLTLHINADGEVAFRDTPGEEAALSALATEYGAICAEQGGCDAETRDDDPVIIIRADGNLDASRIPAILARLAEKDITRIQLATRETAGDAE